MRLALKKEHNCGALLGFGISWVSITVYLPNSAKENVQNFHVLLRCESWSIASSGCWCCFFKPDDIKLLQEQSTLDGTELLIYVICPVCVLH